MKDHGNDHLKQPLQQVGSLHHSKKHVYPKNLFKMCSSTMWTINKKQRATMDDYIYETEELPLYEDDPEDYEECYDSRDHYFDVYEVHPDEINEMDVNDWD